MISNEMTALEISLEASIPQYNEFYKSHGIRTTAQLANLRDNKLEGFVMPLYTTLHYTLRDNADFGITEEDPLLVNMGDRVAFDAVGTYGSKVMGNPVRKQHLLNKEIRKFVAQNKRFQWIKANKALEEVRVVPKVISYSAIDDGYRYKTAPGIYFQRRYNYFTTVIENVVKELRTSARQQFILLEPSSMIPPASRLREVENMWVTNESKPMPLDQLRREMISTDGRFWILQIWLFAGENHRLSILDMIPEDMRHRVDFLVAMDDKFSVLNLGKLVDWIKRSPKDKGLFSEDRAQLVVLRHFMSLQQFGTVSEDTVIVDEDSAREIAELAKTNGTLTEEQKNALNAASKQLRNIPAPANSDVRVNATGVTKTPINIDIKKTKPKGRDEDGIAKGLADVPGAINNPDVESEAMNDVLGEQLEEDLKQLEILEAQRQANMLDLVRDYVAYQPEEFSHTSKLDQYADSLAADGLLSAAEVRRARTLARRYEVLPSPFDVNMSLAEHSLISPEELKITPESSRLVRRDLPGVFDKSMLNYSLKDFQSRYIRDVLSKDLESTVLHLQQGGVAVTDFKAEPKHNYLGSSIEMAFQLTPIVGSPTTVRATLPLPDKNGHFVANGVKYSMRNQRVDKTFS